MIFDNKFLLPWRKRENDKNEDVNYNNYIFSFLAKIMNLYEIESSDIETSSCNILKYGFINGHCGLKKFEYDGKYHVGIGTFSGELDADGYGTDYIITLLNGISERGTIGKDVVVFKWNNIGFSMFPRLEFTADMLSKADTSILYNIVYTRVCPIPIVENENEKSSMKEVISSLLKGEISIFKREQKTHGFYDDNKAESYKKDMLELTSPQSAEYMQNLSRFHDEMIIRLCLEFGVYVSERDKGAQLNNKELDAFKDYCAISSDDTYCMLKNFAKDCKEVFGIDVKVTPKNFTHTNEDIINESENIEKEDIKGVNDNVQSETDI